MGLRPSQRSGDRWRLLGGALRAASGAAAGGPRRPYSSLALELARALLGGSRRDLLLHAAGVLLGLLAALGGVGAAVLFTTFV